MGLATGPADKFGFVCTHEFCLGEPGYSARGTAVAVVFPGECFEVMDDKINGDVGFYFEVVAAIIGFRGVFDDMGCCAHDIEVVVVFGGKGKVGGFEVEGGVHAEVGIAFKGEDEEAGWDVIGLELIVEGVVWEWGDVSEFE